MGSAEGQSPSPGVWGCPQHSIRAGGRDYSSFQDSRTTSAINQLLRWIDRARVCTRELTAHECVPANSQHNRTLELICATFTTEVLKLFRLHEIRRDSVGVFSLWHGALGGLAPQFPMRVGTKTPILSGSCETLTAANACTIIPLMMRNEQSEESPALQPLGPPGPCLILSRLRLILSRWCLILPTSRLAMSRKPKLNKTK